MPPMEVPGAGIEASESEQMLLDGARLDLLGRCGPARDGLPQLAVGRIACVPASGDASFVVMDMFDTEGDLLSAYQGLLEAHGIALRENGGPCAPGSPSEGAYWPGDDAGELDSD